MQLRRSRTQSPDARERYRGYMRKQASHPTLYKDHQPPTIQLGFPPCKIEAPPSQTFKSAPRHWPPPPANSGEPPTSSSSLRALLFLFSLSLTSCLFFFLAATTMATIGGELKLGAHGPGRHGHPRPRSGRPGLSSTDPRPSQASPSPLHAAPATGAHHKPAMVRAAPSSATPVIFLSP